VDADAALSYIRSIVTDILYDPNVDPGAVASDLAEHFEYLDNWIVSGGFLPNAWRFD
jgi:hypothetical protein